MIQKIRRAMFFLLTVAIVTGGMSPWPAVAATCPCNVWPATATPANANASDAGSVELGVKFRSDNAGYITGIRFYKGSQNIGTHTGTLWSSTGTQLATATFSSESASGWQQVSFATPVQISANTTYVASYHAPLGHYAANNNFFATAGVDNAPLHALKNGVDGSNGVYKYGASTIFPNASFQSTNYWVDVVFANSAADTTAPTVSSTVPATGGTNVNATANVTATFSEALNAASVSAATFELRDAGNNLITATVSYDSASRTATLHPNNVLGATSTYTARLKGGSAGIKDVAGNALAADYTWSFTTAGTVPNQGPGGPILVVNSASNPFTSYYTEILRNEGYTNFATADVSSLTSTLLNSYDVVILGELPLTPTQVTMLGNWVNAGGNLVAMKPDKQLASLLGLTDANATLGNAYLKMNTSVGPGLGLTDQTIQFHGTADKYTLNGATNVAELFSNAATDAGNPAVTLRSVGTSGGQAAAFTYDLAKSVVYSRQGNPAWAGQDRDGDGLIRSDDLFFGNATSDPQTDWVDLGKAAIPQADEQQRLLGNLITQMNLDKKPLPHFWYLPGGKKAAVVMTGDDHGNNGTAGRFDKYIQASPVGCSVALWGCVRSTSYMYAATPMTNAQAVSYTNQGFEIGAHITTNCAGWTPSSLEGFFSQQLADFAAAFPGVPAPTTNRTHCIAWSDWATQPKVELAHGIRLDANYYAYPPTWINNRPGFMTSSGMPMRFADPDGSLINVYQAATQMTDESGQTYPFTIDSLLDKATGPEAYYGVLTANMHTDTADSGGSDAIIASAQAHGVPVVSAKQLLNWLDGRNNSTFTNMNWSGSTLTFGVTVGSGAENLLQGMIPLHTASSVVTGVTRDGTAVSYTTETIKGVEYAIFPALAGNYAVTYTADTTAPTVTGVNPANNATNVSVTGPIKATFSEAMDAASINTNTVELRDAANNQVAATVNYDSVNKQAVLTPNAPLLTSTVYTARVKGDAAGARVKDLAGNALASDYVWSFTTAATSSTTLWPSSAVPSLITANDSQAVELGVKFRSDTNGYVKSLRFYKGPNNTGTHTGTLWTSSGTPLANATFTNETTTGWQQVDFATPVAVTAGTTYVASYHTNVGMYSADNNYFVTHGVDSAPLHALQDGVDGGNGVYGYGASSFPTSSYQGTNYWVDVVFSQTP